VSDRDVPDGPTASGYAVELRDVVKRYPGGGDEPVVALDSVDFAVRPGEFVAVVGPSGSGKSTLVKTLVGVHRPDAGTVTIRGEQVEIGSPKQAREYGISTVYQDLALVNEQTVAANMFLARAPMKRLFGLLPVVDWDRMNEEAERILKERMNLDIDPTARVEFLSGGERQSIAIARALVTDPDILILDEPTSALSPDSAKRVEELVQTLREEEGISVVIISHNMDEVFNLTDRITVLDNGNLVGTVDTDTVDRRDIVEMMVGGTMPG